MSTEMLHCTMCDSHYYKHEGAEINDTCGTFFAQDGVNCKGVLEPCLCGEEPALITFSRRVLYQTGLKPKQVKMRWTDQFREAIDGAFDTMPEELQTELVAYLDKRIEDEDEDSTF